MSQLDLNTQFERLAPEQYYPPYFSVLMVWFLIDNRLANTARSMIGYLLDRIQICSRI